MAFNPATAAPMAQSGEAVKRPFDPTTAAPKQTAPVQAEEPPKVSFMDRVNYLAGGFNKGVLDLVDFPIVLGNAAYDTLHLPQSWKAPMPSDLLGFRDAMTAVPESVEQAETPVMDSLRTGLEWGSGAAVPSSKAAKIPDLLAAGGAMLGEQIGGETGELIGGIGGALTPAGMKGLVLPAVDKAKDFFGLAGKQDSETEAVMRFLRGNTDDQGMVDARKAIDDALERGETGSLADMSKSPDLAKVEASSLKDAQTREAMRPVYQERMDKVAGQFDEIAPATGVNPTAPIRSQLGAAKEQARAFETANIARGEEGYKAALTKSVEAENAAKAADAGVGGTGRTDISSAALSDTYGTYEKQLRETLDGPAWKKFDEASQMDIAAMKADISAYTKDLPETMRADMYSKFNSVLRNVKNMGDTADPKDVQYALSAIKDINRSARNSGDFGTLNLKLSEISDIVDSAMRTSPEVGDSFKAAIKATVDKKAMLGGDVLAKARRAEPEIFAQTANFKGDQGATTMRNIAASDNQEIMAGAEAYLRDAIRKEGVSDKTLTTYAAALDYFPELKGQIQKTISTGDTAALAKTAEKQAGSALKEGINAAKGKATERVSKVSKLGLSKYVSAPKKFITSNLSAADDSGQLGQVYKRLQREGKGADKAFKSQVLGTLKDEVLKIDDISADSGVALQNKINRLVENGVLSLNDMDEVSAIIAKQEGRRLRRAGGTVDTAAHVSSMTDDLAATALTLPLLSAMPSGHQLMAAGMLKRNFKQYFQKHRADPKKIRKLEQMLKSPELFIQALDGKLTATSTPREMSAAFAGVIRVLANESVDLTQ
jgi:hypothetical protein